MGLIREGAIEMEQERRERKRKAKIFFTIGMLVLLLMQAMVGIFSEWSSWRPALAYSLFCLAMLVFYMYLGVRWYSRIIK